MGNEFCAISRAEMQQIKDGAHEVMQAFYRLYVNNFGIVFVIGINQHAEQKALIARTLSYQECSSIDSPTFKGSCNISSGHGPGTFCKGQHVYIVEGPDFILNVYSHQTAFLSGKEPEWKISLAGYKLVENVPVYYKKKMSEFPILLDGIDESMGFSLKSWALVHNHRVNYVMELPESEDPVVDVDRSQWINFLKRLTIKASSKVNDQLFKQTCIDMMKQRPELRNWKDHVGTEIEILTDMLSEKSINEVRNAVESRSTSARSKLFTWYKAREKIRSELEIIAHLYWDKLRVEGDMHRTRMKKSVTMRQDKIIAALTAIRKSFEGMCQEQLNDLILEQFSSWMARIADNIKDTVVVGFAKGREIIIREINYWQLPEDNMQTVHLLSGIPHKTETVQIIRQQASAVADAVSKLKLPTNIASVDKFKIEMLAEDAFQRMIDSAVFTYQQKLLAGAGHKATLFHWILQGFDSDVSNVATRQLLIDILQELFIQSIKDATFPMMQPAISSAQRHIPSDVAELIQLDTLAENFLTSVIDKRIENEVTHVTVQAGRPFRPLPAIPPANNNGSRPGKQSLPNNLSETEDLKHYSWFFGRITREQVAELLNQNSQQRDGFFLVRCSQKNDPQFPFVLSVKCNTRQYNLQIGVRASELNFMYSLVSQRRGEQTFPSVEELITYYHQEKIYFTTDDQSPCSCTLKASPIKPPQYR